MIDEVRIAELGVIEEATLPLAEGLTVVTGETGAGKTMLVTALELLLGARADAGSVRSGATIATVEARIRPVPPEAVTGGWVEPEAEELIVSRDLVVPAGGDGGLRSRVRIASRLGTVGDLEAVLGAAVEVHAQGVHARQTRPDVQRALLDRFAGEEHAAAVSEHRTVFREWTAARARIERVETEARDRARELERLRYEVEEITAAALDPAADARLEEELARLEHAEQLTVAATDAAGELDEDGAGGPVGQAVASLRRAASHDPALEQLLDRAEGLAAELTDLRAELRVYAEEVAADPAQLDELRRRERLITDLQRKYGVDVAAVLDYATTAAQRIAELEREEDAAGHLEAEERSLAERLDELAGTISDGRRRAGTQLAQRVSTHLEELAMSGAVFGVRIEPLAAPSLDGADRVTFELAPNPGEDARTLAEAASGGERARVALALEVASADVDEVRVLVFDEVDAGVGGEAAMAVGEKLARLAAGGRQVLCVTHLAQLAAFADRHHVVEKSVEGGRTVTRVRTVEDDERSDELARMLSGRSARGEGRAHARALLADASERRMAHRQVVGGGAPREVEAPV